MHRKKTIRIASAVFLFCVVLGIAVFLVCEHARIVEARNAEFLLKATRTFGCNEPISLNSNEDLEGLDYGSYVASFPWEGTMELTVLDVRVFDSIEDMKTVLNDVVITDSIEDSKLLFLKVKIRNIDAEPINYVSGSYAITSFINLREKSMPGQISSVVYFSGSSSEASEKEKLYFMLEKGETKEFLIGFKMSKIVHLDDLYIGTGLACVDKYSVDLAISE